jgi:hypothetical protein
MKQGSILFCPNEQLQSAKQLTDFLKEHKYNWNLLLVDQQPALELAMTKLISSFLAGEGASDAYQALVKEMSRLSQEFECQPDILVLINDLLVEIEWIIEDEVHDTASYLQDQLLGYSTLLSSYLVYAQTEGLQWLDARDYIITDDAYGQPALLKTHSLEMEGEQKFMSQMLLASTTENNSTMLAQEQKLNCFWAEVLNHA